MGSSLTSRRPNYGAESSEESEESDEEGDEQDEEERRAAMLAALERHQAELLGVPLASTSRTAVEDDGVKEQKSVWDMGMDDLEDEEDEDSEENDSDDDGAFELAKQGAFPLSLSSQSSLTLFPPQLLPPLSSLSSSRDGKQLQWEDLTFR
jgi:hypothetical protein